MLYLSGTSTEVQEVMQSQLITVRANETVGEMLKKMQNDNVSALPVIDLQGKCVGLVSLADVLRTVISTEKALESDYPRFDDCLWAIDLVQDRLGNDKVQSVMSEVLVTVSPDTSMHNAACIMMNNQVHHLPVVSTHGDLVGMVSSLDFVRLAAGSLHH